MDSRSTEGRIMVTQRIRDEIARELRGAHRLAIEWRKEGLERLAKGMVDYADGIRFVVSLLFPRKRA